MAYFRKLFNVLFVKDGIYEVRRTTCAYSVFKDTEKIVGHLAVEFSFQFKNEHQEAESPSLTFPVIDRSYEWL